MNLAERLGYPSTAKLLIVSCDDLGSSHASNEGVYASLTKGWASTAGLMVPAPWGREAAARYRGEDIGIHLTLNAEYESFRWGPVTQAPSLLGGDGGFPRTVSDLWDHADLDECRRECRAQVERAIYWGFNVTHVDSHMGALEMRPEFFDICLELAVEFDLPMRLPDREVQAVAGFPFRDLADAEGVLSPDRVISLPKLVSAEELAALIAGLQPGVTEISLRPAADTPELRALGQGWPVRTAQLALLQDTKTFEAVLETSGVEVIGFKPLLNAQRNANSKREVS